MNNISLRTDLALESAQSVSTSGHLPDGISVFEREGQCFRISDVRVTSQSAAEKIGKPMGRYLTLELNSRLDYMPDNFGECATELAGELSSFIDGDGRILVAGLGNSDITPDSLGPRVCSKILATRHIRLNAPELYSEGMSEVSAIAPGVMGQTGIEVSEIIRSVSGAICPDAVIAVDALACSDIRHIGRTVQLCDSGISPGSGVMNSRKELSKQSLGVKCIAVGVPTVADGLGGGETLMVTPRSVDKMIGTTALLISTALNISLHPGLSREEIAALTS